MTDAPAVPLDLTFPVEPGRLTKLSPLVRRLVAPNPGPMTFKGTCTYVVGQGAVAVIDPGPADPAHIAALLAELGDERVAHILVTHTHRDHSPGARLLREETGAPIIGCAPHRTARPPSEAERPGVLAGNDYDHHPDRVLDDGDRVAGDGFTLEAVATPGHTMNHLAFALPEEATLFSGDHVMAWATTVVVPPSGSMGAYLRSLEKLRHRDDSVYWPGHGGPVHDPQRFVRALLAHRRHRGAAILGRLRAGDATIPSIVAKLYDGLDPRLVRAAGLSVLAHLEDMAGGGLVTSEGSGADATFKAG